MNFMISTNSKRNSASYGPKIIQKVQFLGQIKVKEFWFFKTFFKNPDSFRYVFLQLKSPKLYTEYCMVKHKRFIFIGLVENAYLNYVPLSSLFANMLYEWPLT